MTRVSERWLDYNAQNYSRVYSQTAAESESIGAYERMADYILNREIVANRSAPLALFDIGTGDARLLDELVRRCTEDDEQFCFLGVDINGHLLKQAELRLQQHKNIALHSFTGSQYHIGDTCTQTYTDHSDEIAQLSLNEDVLGTIMLVQSDVRKFTEGTLATALTWLHEQVGGAHASVRALPGQAPDSELMNLPLHIAEDLGTRGEKSPYATEVRGTYIGNMVQAMWRAGETSLRKTGSVLELVRESISPMDTWSDFAETSQFLQSLTPEYDALVSQISSETDTKRALEWVQQFYRLQMLGRETDFYIYNVEMLHETFGLTEKQTAIGHQGHGGMGLLGVEMRVIDHYA